MPPKIIMSTKILLNAYEFPLCNAGTEYDHRTCLYCRIQFLGGYDLAFGFAAWILSLH